MSFGDPVEFVRRLHSAQSQRVGNRIQKEAFTIDSYHCDCALNDVAQVVLPAPGAGNQQRFDYIHYSYSGVPAAGSLQITDGATTYYLSITAAGLGHLTFDTTRWEVNAPVTITLAAGGQGVTGCLNVLGVRYEHLEDDI